MTDPFGSGTPSDSLSTARDGLPKFPHGAGRSLATGGLHLRQTIHAAVTDLISRVAARDEAFDAEGERRKIAFLIDGGSASGAQGHPDAVAPAAERMTL